MERGPTSQAGHDPSGKAPLPLCLVQLLQVCGRVLFSKATVPKVLSMRLRALRGRFCFSGVKVTSTRLNLLIRFVFANSPNSCVQSPAQLYYAEMKIRDATTEDALGACACFRKTQGEGSITCTAYKRSPPPEENTTAQDLVRRSRQSPIFRSNFPWCHKFRIRLARSLFPMRTAAVSRPAGGGSDVLMLHSAQAKLCDLRPFIPSLLNSTSLSIGSKGLRTLQ